MSAVEQHRLTDTRRSLLRHSLKHVTFLEEEICQLDEEIRETVRHNGWERKLELLVSAPGMDQVTSASMLAELGPDASGFRRRRS